MKLSYESIGDRYIHASDFNRWVEGYIDQKPPHQGREYQVQLLSSEQMRDLASHNLYPVIMKLHDMRHIHFAVGHPRAAAVYFASARSTYHRRYAMIAWLYEGVDRVKYQTPHEARLTRYIREKGMNLEEGMLYLGRASQAELEKIMAELDLESAFAKEFPQSWKPTIAIGEKEAVTRPEELDRQIDRFVHHQDQYRREPSKAPYYNYRLDREGGSGSDPMKDDSSIH